MKRKLFALSAILMSGSALSPVCAQTADGSGSENSGAIADIIVTAQKRSQSINDVGLTITALSADILQKQSIKTLDDLARSVPGLSYAGTDFGTPIFTLRGVGYYDNSIGSYPTTSVYIDEVPLPFSVMSLHTNLDLERVEVLKGPQGTLFGQNSTGGAINFIAAKPTSVPSAGVDFTIGRFGQGEANGFVSGPISETLSMRLSGQYGYGGAWQRSATRDDSIGERNYVNGRLLTVWEATPDVRVTLNLNGWRDKSDPQLGQFIALFPQLTLPDGSSAVSPELTAYPFSPSEPRAADWSPGRRPKADKRQYQAALRVDADLTDDITLTSLTSYVDYKSDQSLDMDATPLEVFEYGDQGRIRSFNQELRISGGEGSPFRWIFGGNLELSKAAEKQFAFYAQSTVGALYGNTRGINSTEQRFRNIAVFGNAEYEFGKVTLKAGARYTKTRDRSFTCSADAGDGTVNATILFFYQMLNPGKPLPTLAIGDCTTLGPDFEPGPTNDTLKEDNIAWRLGVDYKASPDLLLYANVAKGYKAGSFPTFASLIYTSYLPVVQESLLDYEAGFKAKLFNRRIGLNGAAFWYDYTNKQLLTKQPDLLSGLSQQIDNVPKSRVRGAELELTAMPVDGLNLSGAMTYLDAKITQYVGFNASGIEADFAGMPMPFTPKWQFTGNVDYDFPVMGSVRPSIGATITTRSGTSSIIGGSLGVRTLPGFRSSVPVSEVFDIAGYTLLDLRAGIAAEDDRWRLSAFAKNVTNKHYWNNVITAFENVVRYAGMPATYGITFSYKFGK